MLFDYILQNLIFNKFGLSHMYKFHFYSKFVDSDMKILFVESKIYSEWK